MRNVVWLGLGLVATAQAVPVQLQHQGRIVDAQGGPVNGSHTLHIALYDADDGADPVWQWSGDATLQDGYYSLLLSGGTPELSASVLDHDALWLGVAVGGDSELAPRTPFASAAFALRAHTAHNVDGGVVNAESVRLIDPSPVSSATCDGSAQGTLRFRSGVLAVCLGSDWQTLAIRASDNADNPGESCLQLRTDSPTLPSNTYWLDPDGPDTGVAPFQAFCDMTTAGGGWTLIARDRLNDGSLLHSTATTWPEAGGGVPGGIHDHLLAADQVAALHLGATSHDYLITATGTRSTEGQHIRCTQSQPITITTMPTSGACTYQNGSTNSNMSRGISIHADSGSCRFVALWATSGSPGSWWQGSLFAEAGSASCSSGWGPDFPHALGPNPFTNPYPQRNTDYTTWIYVR